MNNGSEGSSSSNPRVTKPSPRRSRGRVPPQRRGHPGQLIPPSQTPPMMGVPGQSAFIPFNRHSQPLLMGVPGQSAFTPYARTPPPPSDSNRGPIGSGGISFEGAQVVAIGGHGSGDVAALGPDKPPNENQVRCIVCGKVFRTPKALFGHMRSHPDRGWKGAHPPPAFRAEEEFADLHGEEAAAAAEGGGGEGMEEEYGPPDLNRQPTPDSN